MTRPVIRRARGDEIDEIGALIALSLNSPEANAHRYFAVYTRHAFDYGRVDVIDGGNGLAAAAVGFDRTSDIPDVAECDRILVEEHHPAEPHWHVAFLAVHPCRQNEGFGSALLNHLHKVMDALGLPQYVEAGSRASARLYRRQGYRDMNPCLVLLPDGTPFFRMWRQANLMRC